MARKTCHGFFLPGLLEGRSEAEVAAGTAATRHGWKKWVLGQLGLNKEKEMQ